MATTEGGYLVYNEDSHGILYVQWSKEPVPNALAFFEAGKPIPGFKFKTNHGRQPLTKGVDTKEKWYEGWGGFLKEAFCRYNAKRFCIYEKMHDKCDDVQVVILDNEHKVSRFESNDTWEGDVTSLSSFAVVNKHSKDFVVGTMQQDFFLSKGASAGVSGRLSVDAAKAMRATVATTAPSGRDSVVSSVLSEATDELSVPSHPRASI